MPATQDTKLTMTKCLFVFFLFLSITARCQQKKETIELNKSNFSDKPIQTYKFDTSAIINGCADVLLQKISKDKKFELLIWLKVDSIPKQKEIEISQFSKFILITFKVYSKDNEFIDEICGDLINVDKRPNPPIDFTAISGSLIITRYSDDDFIISSNIKNVTVKNKKGETIILPFEKFSNLTVHWIGG